MKKVTNRPFVLAAVMVAMFISAVEATIVTTAMPVIAADLGGFGRYSWIFSSYLLMSTITVLIYGKLADLFGRKPVLLIGLSIFLVGSILCGMATSMELLIGFRLIQGVGAGAVMPIATTIIGDIYTVKERAKIQGYLSSVWGISAVLGPLIGGGIVHYLSWEYVFWVNVPLGIVAMIGLTVYLHEEKREGKALIDYKGAFFLTGTLVSILFWLTEGGQSFDRLSSISYFLIGSSIVFLIGFVLVERRVPEPMMPFSIWKNPVIFYANIVSFTTGIILIGISSYLPTYVTGVMEQPALIAGFALTAMSIGWPIASSVAGHLLLRQGPFFVSFIGGCSLILGGVLFVWMHAQSGPLLAGVASFFIGVGMGLTSTAFVVTIQNAVTHNQRGAATAANMFMRNFGNTVGAALFGAILNAGLLKAFKTQSTEYSLEDVDQLLTENSRLAMPIDQLHFLQGALDQSLQWVYGGVLLFACISILFILRIPKGKDFQHDEK